MAMAALFPASHVVVVGGGLAGMVAANQVLERGGRVLVLEKSAFCGGNSSKATAGISAAASREQRESFVEDTLHAGRTNLEFAEVLCRNSGPDLSWLTDKFDLDLAVVSKLHGHSRPRTHRSKDGFPGMAITYALIQMVEKVAEVSDRARIITKADVSRLLFRQGNVVGCEYQKAGRTSKEYGPVVLCAGGFGADFGADSLLARHRPDLLHLPTVSVDHCRGDAVKMGQAVGACAVDLEWVQVHPTGLVNPEQPDGKVKVLAGEALRAAGGLLLNARGERFCNELGPMDYIVKEMWKNPAPFRLCLNRAASREMQWQCRLFASRNLMKCYATGKQLAEEMCVPLQRLVAVHNAHAEAWQRSSDDAVGGPWPGSDSSSRSWDEASGRTGCGKCVFNNVLPGASFPDELFHVALVTPVILYCAGGLQINAGAEVIDETGTVIPGLYAAGEATGGVHGKQCLGGNSLLDCVVFGRIAAKSACRYTFGEDDEFRPCPLPSGASNSPLSPRAP
eukprot:gb/GFBE01043333.1/.p1 GENE.gb/GFBE01043333.1/~~gb/GFBE01043333.1/.p1  ORF type:complete len:508 (+),score=80.95 gb/GFBE01043333.1/:1-1524(+)